MSEKEILDKQEIINRFSDPSVKVKKEELPKIFESLDPDSDRERNN